MEEEDRQSTVSQANSFPNAVHDTCCDSLPSSYCTCHAAQKGKTKDGKCSTFGKNNISEPVSRASGTTCEEHSKSFCFHQSGEYISGRLDCRGSPSTNVSFATTPLKHRNNHEDTNVKNVEHSSKDEIYDEGVNDKDELCTVANDPHTNHSKGAVANIRNETVCYASAIEKKYDINSNQRLDLQDSFIHLSLLDKPVTIPRTQFLQNNTYPSSKRIPSPLLVESNMKPMRDNETTLFNNRPQGLCFHDSDITFYQKQTLYKDVAVQSYQAIRRVAAPSSDDTVESKNQTMEYEIDESDGDNSDPDDPTPDNPDEESAQESAAALPTDTLDGNQPPSETGESHLETSGVGEVAKESSSINVDNTSDDFKPAAEKDIDIPLEQLEEFEKSKDDFSSQGNSHVACEKQRTSESPDIHEGEEDAKAACSENVELEKPDDNEQSVDTETKAGQTDPTDTRECPETMDDEQCAKSLDDSCPVKREENDEREAKSSEEIGEGEQTEMTSCSEQIIIQSVNEAPEIRAVGEVESGNGEISKEVKHGTSSVCETELTEKLMHEESTHEEQKDEETEIIAEKTITCDNASADFKCENGGEKVLEDTKELYEKTETVVKSVEGNDELSDKVSGDNTGDPIDDEDNGHETEQVSGEKMRGEVIEFGPAETGALENDHVLDLDKEKEPCNGREENADLLKDNCQTKVVSHSECLGNSKDSSPNENEIKIKSESLGEEVANSSESIAAEADFEKGKSQEDAENDACSSFLKNENEDKNVMDLAETQTPEIQNDREEITETNEENLNQQKMDLIETKNDFSETESFKTLENEQQSLESERFVAAENEESLMQNDEEDTKSENANEATANEIEEREEIVHEAEENRKTESIEEKKQDLTIQMADAENAEASEECADEEIATLSDHLNDLENMKEVEKSEKFEVNENSEGQEEVVKEHEAGASDEVKVTETTEMNAEDSESEENCIEGGGTEEERTESGEEEQSDEEDSIEGGKHEIEDIHLEYDTTEQRVAEETVEKEEEHEKTATATEDEIGIGETSQTGGFEIDGPANNGDNTNEARAEDTGVDEHSDRLQEAAETILSDAESEDMKTEQSVTQSVKRPAKSKGKKREAADANHVSQPKSFVKRELSIEVDDVETAVGSVKPEEITDDSEEVIEDIIEAKVTSDAESSLKIADDTDHSDKMEHVIRMGSKTSEDSQAENATGADDTMTDGGITPLEKFADAKKVILSDQSFPTNGGSVDTTQETCDQHKVDGQATDVKSATAEHKSTTPRRKRKRKTTSRSRSSQKKDGKSPAGSKTQAAKKSPGAAPAGTVTKKAAASKNGQQNVSRASSAESKKIPPIKAPVGNAPPPNVKNVRSKIGSLENIKHKPKGGDKKVESVKLEWNTSSKIGSLENATHKPGGGDKKIPTQKLDFKDKAQSKVGSKDNIKHKPGGGAVKVETQKLEFKEKASSKVGSLDNVKHKPGGGNVKILSEKLNFKERASSKVNSLSGSEKGSTHGSETQSPVPPTSPTPIDAMPPVAENGEAAPEDVVPNGTGASGSETNDASSPEKPNTTTDLSDGENTEKNIS